MLRSSSKLQIASRLAPILGIVVLGLTSAVFIACVGGENEPQGTGEDEFRCGSSSGYGGYGGYGYSSSGYGGYGYSSSGGNCP